MLVKFLKFGLAAFGSMLLGSHCVYMYYQPMADFPEYVKEAEKRLKLKETQIESKN